MRYDCMELDIDLKITAMYKKIERLFIYMIIQLVRR